MTYDIEMIRELGHCSGIENYSRYFDGRAAGTRPFCLLDYFPEDFLMFIDESHVTLPHTRAMYAGDRSRKDALVNYGFRLPSALENRPLKFEEFEQLYKGHEIASHTFTHPHLNNLDMGGIAYEVIKDRELLEEKTEIVDTGIEEALLDAMVIEDFEPEEKVMRVVPLRGMMIYPNTESHLDLGRKFSVNAVQECMRANESLLLAFQKNADAGLPEADNLYEIGVVAKVRRTINLPTEGMRVLVTGLYPVRVLEYHIDENEITAHFEELPEPEYDRNALEVKARAIRHQFEQYAKALSTVYLPQVSPPSVESV